MTTRIPHRRFFHVPHGQPYHLENSIRGIRGAILRGFGWIDLDCHRTHDGVLVGTHWKRPLVHDGFRSPDGKTPSHRRVEDMAWAEVSELRTVRGNYRISKMSRLINYATSHGINVELELKSAHITAADLIYLRNHLIHPGRVQVKALPPFYTALAGAHAAGFTTILLARGRQFPKSAQDFCTFYRGRAPRWV